MLPSILKNRKCESHPTHVRSSTLGRAVVVDTRRSRSNTTTNSHFSADAACLISPLNPRLVFQIHHISSKAFFILQPPPSTTTEYAAYLTCHHHYLYSAPLSLFPLSPSLPPPPRFLSSSNFHLPTLNSLLYILPSTFPCVRRNPAVFHPAQNSHTTIYAHIPLVF